MRTGPDGAVTTTDLRNYHIPQFADVPVTEVYFADTYDALGPFGAKSMSESPYNPVAPALANAIARACGARLHQLPMTPGAGVARPAAADRLPASVRVCGRHAGPSESRTLAQPIVGATA